MLTFLRSLWRAAVPSTTAELVAVEREADDDDALAVAGELAIAEALRLWHLDVYDPKRTDHSAAADASRAVIDECARSDSGAGWSWLPPYAGDGAVEWCGMFAARCWSHAIPLWMRRTWWPSTYRLDTWARYATMDATHANLRPKTRAPRVYLPLGPDSVKLAVEPRAGDILLVGDGKPAYGDHVTLVERYDAERQMFHTVEGNGGGVGPKGNRRQGIVRAERPLGKRDGHSYIARRLIRPSIADLT